MSLQASEIPEEQLLVFLYPGLPTTAELFILPDERTSSLHKKSNEETLETVRVKMCQHVSIFSTNIPRNLYYQKCIGCTKVQNAVSLFYPSEI